MRGTGGSRVSNNCRGGVQNITGEGVKWGVSIGARGGV